jgi:hypothetical protein
MLGNLLVRFVGGNGVAILPTYPLNFHATTGRPSSSVCHFTHKMAVKGRIKWQ